MYCKLAKNTFLTLVFSVSLILSYANAQEVYSEHDEGINSSEKQENAISILKKIGEEDPLVQTLLKSITETQYGNIGRYIIESTVEAAATTQEKYYLLQNILHALSWKIHDAIKAKEFGEQEVNDSFLPIVEQGLKHKNYDIVSMTLVMLESVPSDIERKLLHDILFSGRDMYIKRSVLERISHKEDVGEYVPMLIVLLKEEKDLNSLVLIIGTLGRIGSDNIGKNGSVVEQAIPYFIELAKEHPRELSQAAFAAIGSLKTQKAKGALKILQSYEPQYRPDRIPERIIEEVLSPLSALFLCIYFLLVFWRTNYSFKIGRFFLALYCLYIIELSLSIIYIIFLFRTVEPGYPHRLTFHQTLPDVAKYLLIVVFTPVVFLPLLPVAYMGYINKIVLKNREVEAYKINQDTQVWQKIILLVSAPFKVLIIALAISAFLLFLAEPRSGYVLSLAMLCLGAGLGGILTGCYFIAVFNLRYLVGTISDLGAFARSCSKLAKIAGTIAVIISLGFIGIPMVGSH